MSSGNNPQLQFIQELNMRNATAQEVFNKDLLAMLTNYFGLQNVIISCYDRASNFISWTSPSTILLNGKDHPYHGFSKKDPLAGVVNREATRERLTWDNTTPRVYRATDVLSQREYRDSTYAKFLQQTFGYQYAAIMPFGINGYIHIGCYKTEAEGDFTDGELAVLCDVYRSLAYAYKSFKGYEKMRIVSAIQDEVISSSRTAYAIVDCDMNLLACNDRAAEYFSKILGPMEMEAQLSSNRLILPVSFVKKQEPQVVKSYVLDGLQLDVHPYQQRYVHGMAEQYYWVTVSKAIDAGDGRLILPASSTLGAAEVRVAQLLCEGLTYQAIADELYISYHTVKNHAHNIFKKCGVHNRYQLAGWRSCQADTVRWHD